MGRSWPRGQVVRYEDISALCFVVSFTLLFCSLHATLRVSFVWAGCYSYPQFPYTRVRVRVSVAYGGT